MASPDNSPEPSGGQNDWLYSELFATRQKLKDVQAKSDSYKARISDLKARKARADEEMQQLKSSTWWKLASPLRRLERLFRKRKAGSAAPAPVSSSGNALPATRDDARAARPETASGVSAQVKPMPASGGSVSAGDARAHLEAQRRTALANFLATGSRLSFAPCTTPKVSVLLVLYNRAELTLGCLESVKAWGGDSIEVIIVDNQSTDQTPLLLSRLDGVRIVSSPENLHFLRGCNRGAAEATGEFLLFLNNDATLLPGSVSGACEVFQAVPNAGAVGGPIVLPDGTLQEAGSHVFSDGSCQGFGRGRDPMSPEFHFRREVDYCSAAFLLTPLALFRELGGFVEAYYPAYYEETDYCLRLRAAGRPVIYEPSAGILHFEFGSSVSSDAAILLQMKNRAVFRSRHAGALATHPAPGTPEIEAMMHHQRGPRVFFLDDRVPHQFLGAGYPRSRAMLHLLRELGCHVVLYPLAYPSEDFPAVYQDIDRRVEVATGLRKAKLVSYLRERAGFFDLVLVSRPHNAEILWALFEKEGNPVEGMPIVYDAEAVFSDRSRTRSEVTGVAEDWAAEYTEEMALAAKASGVITVSEADAKRFRESTGKPAHVVGHYLEPAPGTPEHGARTTILFVGAVHEEGTPNADSLHWFLDDVLPLLRIDGLKVEIAGFCALPSLLAKASDRVRFLGLAPDLDPVYDRARVFVAPTRFAAGLPMKIHEAASKGVPVVATPLLAHQLGWEDGRDLVVGDNAENFARAIETLWSDPGKWSAVRSSALDRIREQCGRTTFLTGLADMLRAHCHSGREAHLEL